MIIVQHPRHTELGPVAGGALESSVVRRWLRQLFGLGLGLMLLLLRLSWRVRSTGSAPAAAALYALWHGDQVALTCLPRPLTALVSRSTDGELAAGALRVLGFGVVRGSSSRGAVTGARSLLRCLRGGRSAALAVDGPRGPRHHCSDAPARLARCAGVPLVPVAAAARRCLTLRSWDGMRVPAPFSRVHIVWGAARTAQLEQGLRETWDHAQQLAGRCS